MMYEEALVYNLDGEFVGHAILKGGGVNKLQSVNLWNDDAMTAFQEQLARLNGDVAIRAHWPHINDPEVQALLNDPEFEPYEQVLADVVDEDSSFYVWHKDELGHNTGELDEVASVIATKKALVPLRPSDVSARVRRAHEVVATKRASQ